MMKGNVLLRVTQRGYEPADADAAAQHAKQNPGDLVAGRICRPRSLPQLRLYWAVLQYVAEASEWESAERLHIALKVRLGHYDLMKMPNGKMVPVVHSASFEGMNQDQFQNYMDDAVRLICSEVIPGMDSERLIIEAQATIGTQSKEAA